MAIKNILLQLVPYLQEDALSELAVGLARAHEAKLTGLCVVSVAQIPGFARAYVGEEMMAQARHRSDQAVAAAKNAFLTAAEAQGVATEWVQADGDPRAIAIRHARHADLIMVSQSEPGSTPATATISPRNWCWPRDGRCSRCLTWAATPRPASW